MKRISKRGKKILAMVLALVLVAGLLPNTALFEGWNVVAWATGVGGNTTELSADDFVVTVDSQEVTTDTVSYTYNGAGYEVGVSSASWTGTNDYTWKIVKNDIDVTEIKDAGSYEVQVYPVDGTTSVSDPKGYLTLKTVTVTQLNFSSNSGIFTIEDILYTGESLTPVITVNTSYS
ncbi:MAG: hypothetical protein LIO96_09420, partial [Lachnospiraceae bacterium]|nr:hypothetical protein [Lachnospiraceae bacterium]